MSEPDFLLMMQIITGILVGGTLGSFITMLSYRLPRKLSIVEPGSYCPSCNTGLQIRDLVPVFSYLASKGMCRHCNAPVGPRYFIIELISIGIVTAIMVIGGFSLLSLALSVAFIFAFTAVLVYLDK